LTLGELIGALGGNLMHGSPDVLLIGVEDLGTANSTELVFAENASSASKALAGRAGAVVLRPGCISEPIPPHATVVETDEPRLWFARAAKLINPSLPPAGVHPKASIASDAMIGSDVTIGACAVVEKGAHVGVGSRIDAGVVVGRGTHIGEYCHIYPNVVLYPGTMVGDRVVVHAGAVLGADGFGYVRDPSTGAYIQFPQEGMLLIEDDVEIGANSTIDRGALQVTKIRRGTKIDNLVHIGHNCDIGEDVILVALTGISGSSTVGNGAIIAGQVGIGDHVHIGPGVILGGQAGVFNGKTVTNEGLKPGTVLFGTPARPLKQVLREQATLARLAKRSRKASESASDKEQESGSGA